ncbi:hypothetical protein [Demequina zhanjiangensis]|uniref:Uncharacterized protein n=1 Tax=Demequina zhanjiangensis TaxID=3051659 RepID=A0ABT8G3F6_9MICO|nr:hypothetical protein [Demequina sp. SYSU T00b26]MDN4473454.1 hypothetical protein [Demequina sp. SYSU T00b26]
MGIEKTRREVIRLRTEFKQEPRQGALRLAQQLSWYSMELALAKEYEKSNAAWTEAFDVARYTLRDGGPTQYERTELIRIGVGTARSRLIVGEDEGALKVLEQTEAQYDALVAEATDPEIMLALRGPILSARAAVHHDRGERDEEIADLCESVLEMLAGYEANPRIVESMLREPLRTLHELLSADEAEPEPEADAA